MKVRIYTDEWYPVYEITEDAGYYDFEVELTEAEVEFVKQATEQFNVAQRTVYDAYQAWKADQYNKEG